MRLRLALAGAAIAVLAATTPGAARAEILPPLPPLPTPPAELDPLLELLSGPGGVLTEPGCAALGTVLGLGAVVVPGVPGTIESQVGISLAVLPIALQPELLRLVDTLLFVQGSGCGLLPLAAERMVCASDDDMDGALQQIRQQLNLIPDLPVQVGDFVPVPAPTLGALVDTVRVLAELGLPGATEVSTALADVGSCGLRKRFTNVVAPELPADPVDAEPIPLPSAPGSPPGVTLPAFNRPAAPPTPPLGQIAVPAVTTPVESSLADQVPRWLQNLAVLSLIAFLYRSLAPRRDRPGTEQDG